MKRTARVMCVTAICICCLAVTSQAYEWEMQGAGGLMLPSDDMWDSAWSGEFKVIAWDEDFGLALTAGLSQWNVKDKEKTLVSTSNRTTWHKWDGDVQYIPLGVSLLQRCDLSDWEDAPLIAQFEAGLLYMMSNGNMQITETDRVLITLPSTYSETVTTTKVTTDDTLVARVGVSLQWDMNQQTVGILSGGYQFDLTKGDATASNLTVAVKESVDLSAAYAFIGFAYRW